MATMARMPRISQVKIGIPFFFGSFPCRRVFPVRMVGCASSSAFSATATGCAGALAEKVRIPELVTEMGAMSLLAGAGLGACDDAPIVPATDGELTVRIGCAGGAAGLVGAGCIGCAQDCGGAACVGCVHGGWD